MHTLHSSLHFSSIWTTQEHCSCWIVWSYYYFGTEDLKTDQNKHCEQNSKWQRPAEVTKVCIEEASACGQVGWWKGCVHPLTAIHGDSTGTILLQGQGTIQRWTKLHWQPGREATPGQRSRELLDQSDISYGLTGPAQLKAPRKGVWGYWWYRLHRSQSAVWPGSQEGKPHPGVKHRKFCCSPSTGGASPAAASETSIRERKMVWKGAVHTFCGK